MKSIWGLFIVVGFALAMGSCFDPPEYPNEPQIEFNNLIFKEVGGVAEADSLILFIDFRDGDGDLGLNPNETGCQIIGADTVCYNNRFYIINSEDNSLVNYKDKRENPEWNLPDFVPPFSCTNWEVLRENNVIRDTLYFVPNQDHYNIFVDFYEKQADGTFKLFNFYEEFQYPNCPTTFDGRFPILSKNLSQPGPLEGTLRYAMVSSLFKLQFSIKTLKLKIQIQDRRTNLSNEIETPEFRFE
ncbi:MAG: hypothetical protein RLN86_13120 [Cyclobacteriaceae bacterium]